MATKYGKPIRIALTGPESTGKTSLAAELAAHFKSPWVPEYAREYLEKLDHPYKEEDLLKIARGQRRLVKDKLETEAPFIFCDTEMINMKIWSEHKFGRVNEKILGWIEKKPYHLYLLCYPDLQWAADALRENPGEGDYFFRKFEEELSAYGFPYEIIRGSGNDRFQSALEAIKKHFPL